MLAGAAVSAHLARNVEQPISLGQRAQLQSYYMFNIFSNKQPIEQHVRQRDLYTHINDFVI